MPKLRKYLYDISEKFLNFVYQNYLFTKKRKRDP